MAGTSSVVFVVPGCTVQLGRPWRSENETRCANACEMIDSESSLAIESGDMLGDEVVGLMESFFLSEESSLGQDEKLLLLFDVLSLWSKSFDGYQSALA